MTAIAAIFAMLFPASKQVVFQDLALRNAGSR